MTLIIPEGYKPLMDVTETERNIKRVKDFFQLNLSTELRLIRVTAPVYVSGGRGINDDLNGVEKPVEFHIKDTGKQAEIVHSLAKWKRLKLADYGFDETYGLYTDMNAIRADETLDNIHSLYVDQWDWEKIISSEQRTLETLKKAVRSIYDTLRRTEFYMFEMYNELDLLLPEEITFIHSEQLLAEYPDLPPEERENRIAERYGAVFIIGIGQKLSNGQPHDRRAPDYDDWSSSNSDGYTGLNGDIVVWNPILHKAFEISSMGIRVDPAALRRQIELTATEERSELYFHNRLLNGELPLSIGGGIGQSRLCMFFLRKAHIGEIQCGIWPDEMIRSCRENNIFLL